MSSESQTLSTAKSDAPAYKVIAEQIAGLLAAGEQTRADQDTIRAALHVFAQVANQPPTVSYNTAGNACGNACLSKGY